MDNHSEKYGEYFGNLFADFDGETSQEIEENRKLGFLACVSPEHLTKREIFIISFILERMQFAKFGNANMLEAIRNHILDKLNPV